MAVKMIYLSGFIFLTVSSSYIIFMELKSKMASLRAGTRTHVHPVKSASEIAVEPDESLVVGAPSKKFEKYQIFVEVSQLQSELKMIEWRSKTQLPIVKVLFYKILQKKLMDEDLVIQVAIENFPSSLHMLPQLQLFQLLYLLKESLIGFERLFDRFGGFDITDKMILINKNNKCKVWINESVMFNFPGKRNKKSQIEVLGNAISVFEEKSMKSGLANQFFSGLGKVGGFAESVQFIDNFVKANNKILSNRLILPDTVALRRFMEKQLIEQKQGLLGPGSLKKIPKFIGQKKSVTNKDQSSNSNISKNSQISDNALRKPKSVNIYPKSVNNQAKSVKLFNEVRQQQGGQNSPRKFSHLSTYSPKGKPNFKYEKQGNLKIESNQQLYLTKQPTKQPLPCKIRKMSTEAEMNNFKAYVGLAERVVFKASQQTAATVDEMLRMEMRGQEIKDLIKENFYFSFIQQNDAANADNIFERNGWTKTVSVLKEENEENLVEDGRLRQTIKSQDDGQQFFSDDYLRVNQNLPLLGSMGKELKSSINRD